LVGYYINIVIFNEKANRINLTLKAIVFPRKPIYLIFTFIIIIFNKLYRKYKILLFMKSKSSKRIPRKNTIAAVVLLISAIYFITIFLSRPRIDSKDDLIELNGLLSHFSFIEKITRGHPDLFYIHLNDYNNGFQIFSDVIDHFDKRGFEDETKIGDSIRLKINSADKESLNKGISIRIFSISGLNKTYLNETDTIPIYNGSQMELYTGLICIIAAVAFFFWKDKPGNI
jgi:hypothetical protein